MSKTLATLDAEFLEKIAESSSNSHFTAAERYGFINEAIQKIAVTSHHPRKLDSGTQGIAGTADYDAASDFVYLVRAFYGDASISGNIQPLKVMHAQAMGDMVPSWIETGSQAWGMPRIIIPMDRNTHRLFPTPDATNAATGRKLWRIYSYMPATVALTTDIPDLPDVYHDCIKYYAAYLANAGRLQNPEEAALMIKLFDKEIEERSPDADMEAEELQRFTWSYREP